jgi:hypothetical protein
MNCQCGIHSSTNCGNLVSAEAGLFLSIEKTDPYFVIFVADYQGGFRIPTIISSNSFCISDKTCTFAFPNGGNGNKSSKDYSDLAAFWILKKY